jgi:hypothetical protein
MDGVDQLNNILLIGMTNRLDMIDEALLRPGRLEVHMEINLPDEHGRRQIISIQTNKMRTNGVMDDDVDLDELAAQTKNFSGAEIAGLVKSATSFAFNRHVKVGTMAGISDDVEGMRVNRDDFMHALDEVQPAFGVAEEELQQVVSNGIMHFAPHIDVGAAWSWKLRLALTLFDAGHSARRSAARGAGALQHSHTARHGSFARCATLPPRRAARMLTLPQARRGRARRRWRRRWPWPRRSPSSSSCRPRTWWAWARRRRLPTSTRSSTTRTSRR